MRVDIRAMDVRFLTTPEPTGSDRRNALSPGDRPWSNAVGDFGYRVVVPVPRPGAPGKCGKDDAASLTKVSGARGTTFWQPVSAG
jgi:hypothetical protein